MRLSRRWTAQHVFPITDANWCYKLRSSCHFWQQYFICNECLYYAGIRLITKRDSQHVQVRMIQIVRFLLGYLSLVEGKSAPRESRTNNDHWRRAEIKSIQVAAQFHFHRISLAGRTRSPIFRDFIFWTPKQQGPTKRKEEQGVYPGTFVWKTRNI